MTEKKPTKPNEPIQPVTTIDRSKLYTELFSIFTLTEQNHIIHAYYAMVWYVCKKNYKYIYTKWLNKRSEHPCNVYICVHYTRYLFIHLKYSIYLFKREWNKQTEIIMPFLSWQMHLLCTICLELIYSFILFYFLSNYFFVRFLMHIFLTSNAYFTIFRESQQITVFWLMILLEFIQRMIDKRIKKKSNKYLFLKYRFWMICKESFKRNDFYPFLGKKQ